MNADEIARMLRDCAQDLLDVKGGTRKSAFAMIEASSLIESLRAENEQFKSDLAAMTKLANAKTSCRLNPRTDCAVWQENESLQKQLADAKRRADAAVEDLKRQCVIGETDSGKPIYGIEICLMCAKNNDEQCDCSACIGDAFEWRGPKGEVK